MMRRRIATKGQNLCAFCCYRSAVNSLSTVRSNGHHVRTYISNSSPLRRPFGAAVAERQDDEEDSPSRFRRAAPSSTDQPRHPARQDEQRTLYTPFTRRAPRDAGYDRTQPRARLSPDREVPRSSASGGFGALVDNAVANREGNIRRQTDRYSPGSRAPRTGDAREYPRDQGRFGSRSQNSFTGFDAFSQAVRATEPERGRSTGSHYNNRAGANDARHLGRGRHGESTQNFRGRAQKPFGSPRGPAGAQEPVQDDPGLDDATPAFLKDDVEEEASRRKDRSAKRASRSDRYAGQGEEDFAPPQPNKKGKGAKERTSQAEREIQRREEEIQAELYGEEGGRKNKPKQKVAPLQRSNPRRIDIPEFMSVQSMAQALNVRLDDFMDKLEEEGFEGARHDHLLDSGTSSMFAELYGFDPVLATSEAQQDLVARPPAQDQDMLPSRPPIVTIMGHVDHGKTTILDYLRKANVVASEHGGITQHIGAFSVVMPGTERRITFLDTPGHAAFLDMRRRGANVTDIVVLVVAADDSVKPQTEEAIKHAQEANVQIIVAINKVDKDDANIEKVKQDLSRHNVIVEDYGGDYQAIALSGKTGQGMDRLEEAIITLADVSDFRAETDGPAEGWIIESKVTLAGRVATVLVRRGTLRPGDFIVAGNTWARVRTLRNDQGDVVTEAPPGTPVQIDGWRGEDPTAGLEVLQADNEQHAKEVVDLRLEKAEALRNATDMAAINASRSDAAEARSKVLEWQAEQGFQSRKQARIRLRDSREGWVEAKNQMGPQKVHLVVKADVAGSVEAVVAAVSAIGNSDVQANVIHSGTGQLTESDIRMLATSGEVAYAVTFNQPVDGTIYRLAEAAGLEIIDHNVIYKVTDIVKEKVAAELPPIITTKVLGEAEIGQIFDVTIKKIKHKIAGCRVTNGTISRAQKVRVIRGEDVVYTGTLDSLKNVKKDVTEMRKGSECGMAFDQWEDMQDGDRVQCFEEISEKRKLY